MTFEAFLSEAMDRISKRKKMTSRLYQVILEGNAGPTLLQNFVLHRYPIKNLWVRHLMCVGSRIEDHVLRRLFVENAYEEETGGYTDSDRHVTTFLDFGECVGIAAEDVIDAPVHPDTQALVDFNLHACNDTNTPLTDGATSVLLLMEGQPPIVNSKGESMEAVIRDTYGVPQRGYEFFTHHASSTEADGGGVSALEDEHTAAIIEALKRFCDTDELQQSALDSLDKSIELRHKHFDMIYDNHHDPSEEPFRYQEAVAA